MVSVSAGMEPGAVRRSLSRVTLVGERRRVELVVPAQETVGVLLPEILRALGEHPGADQRRLVTVDGTVLAASESLASAQVADGAVLRLVREQQARGQEPSGPTAHDVGDEVADELEVRGWRWGELSRSWTAGAGSVAVAVIAGMCAARWYGPGQAALWLGVAAVLATAAGAAYGWLGRLPSERLSPGRRATAAALLLVGGSVGVLASWQATEAGAARLAAVGLTVAAVLALLGLCTALGRAGLIGAGAVALAVGCWEAGLAVTDGARTGVALGIVSVLVLGQLPRLALTAAGLTRLDDRRSGGTPVSRHQVGTALGSTHRELTLATLATALSAAAAGILAAGADDGWSVGAAVLLCGVLFSRARAYPLAVEVVALLAAGAAVGVCLLLRWASGAGATAGALTALCVLAVLSLVVLAWRVPDHVQVRLRRWANVVESVGVVALIPVALGAFGVYTLLLRMF